MPDAGRFAGRDILKGQVELPTSINEYTYCHNNPIGFMDHNGMAESKDEINKILDYSSEYVMNEVTGQGIENSFNEAVYEYKFENTIINYNNEYGKLKQGFVKQRIDPVVGVVALVGIGVYEYFSNDREKVKTALNSLE